MPASGVSVRSALLAVLACGMMVPVQGAYRFGTLSWRQVKDPGVPPYTVDFELVTAWKRDFNWVYVSQADPCEASQGSPCSAQSGCACRTLDSKPIVGDKLRITGLSFADDTGMQAVEKGTSEILFHTDDGQKYFVDIDVTAYSESEGWVMGMTKIRHTYQKPYKDKSANIYPTKFQYEAGSATQLDANQPFTHKPWTARFEGCCRWESSLEGNKNKAYSVVTNIDMTDRDNAPAARTMPIIVVPLAATKNDADQPRFFVMAKDQYVNGSQAPTGMSGGTTNYPVDDQEHASLTYKIAQATDLFPSNSDASSKYTPFSMVSVEDPHTGKLKIQTNWTGGNLDVGYYQVAVRVDSCTSREDIAELNGYERECLGGTVIDFMVQVVGNDGMLPMPVSATGVALTGDSRVIERKFGWVGFDISAHVRINNPRNQKLVLNYVFAGLSVEGSSAEGQDYVQYSEQGQELNHQGMPAGANLFSTATGAVVELAISFDNPFAAHRPGHDAAVNKDKLDFAFAPEAKRLWEAGFRPVLKPRHLLSEIKVAALDSTISYAAFDMNAGVGGAAVYLWLRKADDEPAVTELAISHCDAEVQDLKSKGFAMLPQDVNMQSKSTTVVNVWYKKGTGPAITDVMLVDQAVDVGNPSGSSGPDCSKWCNSTGYIDFSPKQCQTSVKSRPCKQCGASALVMGDLNFNMDDVLLNARGIFMYVSHAPEHELRRMLRWSPEIAGHYIFCYQGVEAGALQVSSTQRCIDLDIQNDPAPSFEALNKTLETAMGKTLVFNISYVDINHQSEVVSINEHTEGLMLAGANFVGSTTRKVLNDKHIRTTQVIEWFPTALYGGFHGDICYTGEDAGLCRNMTRFEDSEKRTCGDYAASRLCVNGEYVGEGKVGDFANAQGVHAGHACCVCGGGARHRKSQSTKGCVNIRVERCQWYVQREDTLIQVAARFATNWLQIWHFNPEILHPDSELEPGSLINIGHLYEVEPNDAMAVLAERFGTSIKHIKVNNWDLARMPDQDLPLGKSICIIPNSCVTAEHVVRDIAA